MVSPLLEMEQELGRIPPHEKRLLARLHGVDVRTVERALAEAKAAPPSPRKDELPREALVRVALCGGNKHQAWTQLVEEGLYNQSYQTFCRRLDEDRGLKLALGKGPDALQRFLEYGVYESVRHNELWYGDAMHVPMRCRGPRGELFEDLHLVSLFDDHSRACLAFLIKVGAPDAVDALNVFHAAVLGRSFSRDELETFLSPQTLARLPVREGERPYVVGGVPESHLTDNGSIYTSDSYAQTVRGFVAAGALYSDPYMPAQRGKHERWHRTLQQGWLAGLPGYLDGPKRPKGSGDRPYSVPRPGDLPSLAALGDVIEWMIDDYNRHHVVSTTGQTPYERWFSDPTPLRQFEPINLWSRMPTIGEYKVDVRGVWVDGAYRAWPGRGQHVGKQVEVRGFPGIPGRLFARPEGEAVHEVIGHSDRTSNERTADAAANASRMKRARAVLAEAEQRNETRNDAEARASGAVESRTYKRGRKSNPTPLRDPDAALDFEANVA